MAATQLSAFLTKYYLLVGLPTKRLYGKYVKYSVIYINKKKIYFIWLFYKVESTDSATYHRIRDDIMVTVRLVNKKKHAAKMSSIQISEEIHDI
jgi:hypothetical protein